MKFRVTLLLALASAFLGLALADDDLISSLDGPQFLRKRRDDAVVLAPFLYSVKAKDTDPKPDPKDVIDDDDDADDDEDDPFFLRRRRDVHDDAEHVTKIFNKISGKDSSDDDDNDGIPNPAADPPPEPSKGQPTFVYPNQKDPIYEPPEPAQGQPTFTGPFDKDPDSDSDPIYEPPEPAKGQPTFTGPFDKNLDSDTIYEPPEPAKGQPTFTGPFDKDPDSDLDIFDKLPEPLKGQPTFTGPFDKDPNFDESYKKDIVTNVDDLYAPLPHSSKSDDSKDFSFSSLAQKIIDQDSKPKDFSFSSLADKIENQDSDSDDFGDSDDFSQPPVPRARRDASSNDDFVKQYLFRRRRAASDFPSSDDPNADPGFKKALDSLHLKFRYHGGFHGMKPDAALYRRRRDAPFDTTDPGFGGFMKPDAVGYRRRRDAPFDTTDPGFGFLKPDAVGYAPFDTSDPGFGGFQKPFSPQNGFYGP